MKEGTKYDAGKADWALLPWSALEELAEIATYGAQKYSADNWKKVTPLKNRYFSACLRHVRLWMRGERFDKESNRHHLVHAAWSLLAIAEVELPLNNVLEAERRMQECDSDDSTSGFSGCV